MNDIIKVTIWRSVIGLGIKRISFTLYSFKFIFLGGKMIQSKITEPAEQQSSAISNPPVFDVDMLDIDIDLEDNSNINTTPCKMGLESNVASKRNIIQEDDREEASRNPKRKKTTTQTPFYSQNLEIEPNIVTNIGGFSSENYLGTISSKIEASSKTSVGKTKIIDTENWEKGKPSGSIERRSELDSDDDSDENMDGGKIHANKNENNTTFSQVEEVIELDSDGEDPAYQSWCSRQVQHASNVKLERPVEHDNDAISVGSYDSPSRSSPKDDDFLEGKLILEGTK